MTEIPRVLAARWLDAFPPETHQTIEAWFRHSSRDPGLRPDAVLVNVAVLVSQALSWSATPERRQLCSNVLTALRCDREGAVAYAQHILMQERPDADKQNATAKR